MACQLRIDARKAPPKAVKKHLSKKQRKRLARDNHLIISPKVSPQEAVQMRAELAAVYVS